MTNSNRFTGGIGMHQVCGWMCQDGKTDGDGTTTAHMIGKHLRV